MSGDPAPAGDAAAPADKPAAAAADDAPPPLSSGKKALFGLILVGLILLVTELAMRGYEWSKAKEEADRGPSTLVSVSDATWLLQPSWEGVLSGEKASINSLGMRGAEPASVAKAAGVTRVICVGDSVTFGYGNATSYPAELGRLLAERRPDEPIEVWNAGMYGYDSTRALVYLSSYLLEHDPDVVVILIGWNDALGVSEEEPRWAAIDAVRPATTDHGILDHTAIGRRLRRTVAKARKRRKPDARALADAARGRPQLIREAAVEHHRRNLEAMARACRAAGATPVLVTMPHFLGAGEGPVQLPDEALAKCVGHLVRYDNLGLEGWRTMAARFDENARAVAGRVEGTVLAETGALADHGHFYDLVHPTDEGQAVLAGAIAETLERDVLGR